MSSPINKVRSSIKKKCGVPYSVVARASDTRFAPRDSPRTLLKNSKAMSPSSVGNRGHHDATVFTLSLPGYCERHSSGREVVVFFR